MFKLSVYRKYLMRQWNYQQTVDRGESHGEYSPAWVHERGEDLKAKVSLKSSKSTTLVQDGQNSSGLERLHFKTEVWLLNGRWISVKEYLQNIGTTFQNY